MTTGPDKIQSVALKCLISDLIGGHVRALSRAISIVENELSGAAEILTAIRDHPSHATVVGITGPPGAGKSTLVSALVAAIRLKNMRVAVLAVDPSSPLTGGAILGDRVRMQSHTDDSQVYVRSIASRGHLGGLFRTVWGVLRVMEASGSDFIIIETVGAGQSEVEIAHYADVSIVLCAPGLGDDIQAMKAGILEIADIFVVNKSDHPLARNTVTQLQAMLALRNSELDPVAVIPTIATDGSGVPSLLQQIEQVKAASPKPRVAIRERSRRLLADAAIALVRTHLMSVDDPMIADLCNRMERREIDPTAAAAEWLDARAK
ncbi:MAG TPA: methylmalonyl Co-A mutase-associated GTPase MeaB, partial [Bellilinea sp.]|nr:methylmalonyl Co-A mutase-associated GTPase MeaB [Bellilinea sp.]